MADPCLILDTTKSRAVSGPGRMSSRFSSAESLSQSFMALGFGGQRRVHWSDAESLLACRCLNFIPALVELAPERRMGGAGGEVHEQ